jgi:hypothetical protein
MLKILPILLILLFTNITAIGQTFTYTFVDPCTKEITQFNLPIQSGNGSLVSFLGQQKYFTADDVISGVFATWINQVYTEYRRLTPCSIQTTTIIRNQITSQIIGNTIQSVVGSIMGQVNAESGMLVNTDLSSNSDEKTSKNEKNEKKSNSQPPPTISTSGVPFPSTFNSSVFSSNNTPSPTSTTQGGGNSTTSTTKVGGNSTTSTTKVGGNSTTSTTQGGGNSTTSTTKSGGNSTTSTTKSGGQTGGQGSGNNTTKTEGNGGPSVKNNSTTTETTNTSTTSNSTNTQETTKSEGGQTGGQTGSETGSETGGQGSEVAVTTTMTTDANNDKGSGGSKGGGKSNSRSNPIIVSSDLTSAQNMDRSFTPIINVGMSQSSMTGTSSWGLNSMIWLNFKQFALTGRYTKMHFSKNKKLKLIHNLNLTGVYSYGNLMSFLGYSMILNAGKYGITGFNVSGSITKSPEDVNLYLSPAMTAFYTKPFKVGKRMILSPELYVISTPLMYSSVDKVSVSDRTFSAFIGTSVDYQFSKRFKVNMNYKLNTSTNPDFPVLSFFLIGSKINL